MRGEADHRLGRTELAEQELDREAEHPVEGEPRGEGLHWTGEKREWRDEAVVHLWEAGDEGWRRREDLAENPVCSGAESFIAGTASTRIEVEDVDGLYEELSVAEVLHPVSRDGVDDTDFGTREFATLDCDGNLLSFFRWVAG